MTKLKMLRISAAVATGVSLCTAVGVVGASAGTISYTGPDSHNSVKFENNSDVKLKNNNKVDLANSTGQSSATGDATVKHNTTGEGAKTGSASNDNSVGAEVAVSNSNPAVEEEHHDGPGWGLGDTSIDHTGPDSHNVVKVENNSSVKVTNNNTVNLVNTTEQNATSGNAKVSGNTTGGDAKTGNASNSTSSVFTISISN